MKLLLQLCFALFLELRAGAADNLPGLVYQPDGDAKLALDERETPRLCRGDSQSLTAPGVI